MNTAILLKCLDYISVHPQTGIYNDNQMACFATHSNHTQVSSNFLNPMLHLKLHHGIEKSVKIVGFKAGSSVST